MLRLDHRGRVFDADNDPDVAAFAARFDVDVDDAIQALRPGHRWPAFGRRWRFIGGTGRLALAPIRGGHRARGVCCSGMDAMRVPRPPALTTPEA
ncbi:hypothetical protein [Aquisalimonas sp.]|uniref:hypothetical protein n=1 Tax=Aquisalimonas sp. TaxID=1872621 RepID=UPI0025C3E306|nr:hypothetical protein [Aquisalimonas sp.]